MCEVGVGLSGRELFYCVEELLARGLLRTDRKKA